MIKEIGLDSYDLERKRKAAIEASEFNGKEQLNMISMTDLRSRLI